MKATFKYTKTQKRINELRDKEGGVASLSDKDYAEFKNLVAQNSEEMAI